MSRLQAIENALLNINETVFQELCECYLKLRNQNYLAFSRTGSVAGKQKTKLGTPDAFFLLPNGKYLYIEVTTNTSDKRKLEKDIKACFDNKKTKIPTDKIEEIVLCFNWNINQTEIDKLDAFIKKYNPYTTLTYQMLGDLAIELHLNHRDLAHEYLGLPLDTGQIVSIEKFIDEYGRKSKGIAPPLNNTFLHRDQELKELKETIPQHDFVILTGAPGIGKTKLALEGINNFLSENLSYTAYCVSYKHHTLLDDLYQYFDAEKDYILFVDDANRIDAFSQITGFYKASRKGKLKILVTVRDYAFQDIKILCQEYSPKRIDILKLTDEQILDIIKAKPFETNPFYHRQILHIAEGNPRLAIMTALLANAKMDIYALHDVSDLFESYFSTFVSDEGEFANKFNIKCLGLISFFYTIPYKNREITSSILDNFGLDYTSFIDAIDKLDKLELVEIQFEHVKIPEQNLSTYFFYKVFVKDNLLPFEALLNKYFESNTNRFKDCVIPVNNTFGYKNVIDKLKPFLQNYWRSIAGEQEKAFQFLSIFWLYLANETLEFLFKLTQLLPDTTVEDYKATYKNNDFSFNKNHVIKLFVDFFRASINLKDALEIAFEYTRKKPEHLPELIHEIREQMIFDSEDERFSFDRQTILFQVLIDGLNKKDTLLSTIFYELSKTFLSFRFHHTKGGRNHKILFYEYFVPNTPSIQDFRKNIWNAVDANYEVNPSKSFELLESYAMVHPDVSKEVMEFDVAILINIIEKHLSPSLFEHCKYVQNQVRWCKRNSVSHTSFNSLTKNFINPTYETYLKIDWDRLRDKEMYEFDDYEEYEKLKEAEIRSSFIFNHNEEIKEFYSTFVYVKKTAKNEWGYKNTLDHVIDENCFRNFQIGCELLKIVVENKNEVNYIPSRVFLNHLKTNDNIEIIWNIMQQNEFVHKSLWELSFYDCINDSLLSSKYVLALLNTVSNMKDGYLIHFNQLKRFLTIVPNLFQIILKKIVERNEQEGTKLNVWMDFFSEHFDQLGNDIELIKKAYLQQDKIQNHYDYEGKGFLNILKKDSTFLLDYVNSLYATRQFGLSADHRNLSFVWHVEKIESILNDVFELIIEKESYFGISDHFCNSFFKNLQLETKKKATQFLIEYTKTSYSDSDKMNIIVDIVRHSMKESFDEILRLFLSLNQDEQIFSKIYWRGNGGSYSGNVIIGDIQAAEWRNILEIINKLNVGAKLLPIKMYLNEQIDNSEKYGNMERQRRFLNINW